MILTDEQERAATDHGRALLVSASAGTGKTTVLAERVARFVDAGTSLERILVVTYTERAAAQMRLRIGKVLRQRAASWPQGDPRQRQLLLLDGAPIQTFHAFGDRVIREFGGLFGVDPDSALLEGPAQHAFELGVLSEILDSHQETARLASFFGGRSQERLEDAILGVARFVRTLPDPAGWLAGAASRLTDPDHAERLYAIARRARLKALDGAREDLGEAARAADRLGLDAYAAAIDAWVPALDEWVSRAAAAYPGEPPSLKPLPATRGFEDEKKVVQDLLSRTRKTLAANASWLAFWDDRGAREAEADRRAPDAQALLDVTRAHLAAYEAAKRSQRVIDFDDQAFVAHRLVAGRDVPAEVAASLRGRFDAILVDEFQDANAVQGALVDGLGGADGQGLFMVGDVKQSIYAFRHAAPHLFLERHERYGDPGADGPWRLPLRENFRSTSAILGAVNGVFERIMVGGGVTGRAAIAYDGMHRLIPGRPAQTMEELPTDVRLVVLPRAADESPPEEDADEAAPPETLFGDEVEAAWVAAEIQRMVASKALVHDPDTGERRPLRYGDIAILARGLAPMAGAIADALTKAGVPFTMSRGRLVESLEYQTLKALLSLLEDPPARPVELATILRSPIFHFSLARLAEIGLRRGRNLWRGLVVDPSDVEATAARATLERWRETVLLRPLGDALEGIVAETRLPDLVAGLPLGAQRQMDIEAVLALARKAEGGLEGLAGFLTSLEAMEGRREVVEVSGVRLASPDAVSVMTVHGAKGLEFGAVFVTRLGSRFGGGGESLVTMHRDLGVEVASVNHERHVTYTSPFQEALDVENAREDLEEEMRILYVAMTRARDHLVLVASSGDPESEMAAARLSDPLRAASALDWLLPAARAGVLTLEAGALEAAVPVAATYEVPAEVDVAHDVEARMRRLPDLGQAATPGPPLRLTATGLAEEAMEVHHTALHPLPLPGSRAPAEVGNLTHAFIEQVDLAADLSEEGLRSQVTRCIEAGILPPDAGTEIKVGAIAHFFVSAWGKRVLASDTILREAPFALVEGEPGRESVLQGKLDLLAIKGDEAIIVDFKTDRISAGDEAERARAYAPQMRVYRRAVTELTGAVRVTVCLYFTQTGSTNVDPDRRWAWPPHPH